MGVQKCLKIIIKKFILSLFFKIIIKIYKLNYLIFFN